MKAYARVLMAAIAWGVLAFGAVYPWAYWPLAAASAALGAVAAVRTRAWEDPRSRTLALGVALTTAAVALQLVPLPYDLVMRLSPGVDHFLREYDLGYRTPTWHALSIDPVRTLDAAGRLLAFGVLLVGLTRALRHIRLDWLAGQIMGLGVALAVIGVVQKALMDPREPLVYGFWRPLEGGSPFGPFINRNHFAGWMLMALPLVVAYSCAVLQQARRPSGGGWREWARWLMTMDANRFVLTAFAASAMGTALVLTGSRSGIASLVVVAGVLGYFILCRAAPGRLRVAGAAYVAVVLIVALSWAGIDRAVERFGLAGGDLPGRLDAWRDTARIIRDFPVFGSGLGTYGLAMLVYQTAGRPAIYFQAHNDYLQIAAEGGALVTVPAAFLAVAVLRATGRRLAAGTDGVLTGWMRAGAVAGLAGIATQSLVEFSLQMPGNAVLCVLLLALAMHRPARRSDAHRV